MNPSEQFRKQAAECQDMVKFARSRESNLGRLGSEMGSVRGIN